MNSSFNAVGLYATAYKTMSHYRCQEIRGVVPHYVHSIYSMPASH